MMEKSDDNNRPFFGRLLKMWQNCNPRNEEQLDPQRNGRLVAVDSIALGCRINYFYFSWVS